MSNYTSKNEYLEELASRAILPEGFKVSCQPLTFYPKEKGAGKPYPMNLSLILLDEPTESFGGLLTRNAVPGYPVLLAKERLLLPFSRGVFINNKIANVCSPGGLSDARYLLEKLEALTGTLSGGFFNASTGIIGWRLPVQEMEQALPDLVVGLQSQSILPVAKGIMTTDAYPKIRRIRVGEGSIVGIAKGAGMIEPNLATMLVFLLTDISIDREALRESLERAVSRSFNRISVDGDQSTSDMVLGFSSCKKPAVTTEEFTRSLEDLCILLARDIAANGEGVHHVIKVTVSGAQEEGSAVSLAKAVVNSPLVKTAVFGNDPNVGRIIMALGNWFGNKGVPLSLDRISISLGGRPVFKDGAFIIDSSLEEALSGYFREAFVDPGQKGYPEHERTVDIDIDLSLGRASASVLGNDLSYDYVKENADYRS